MVVCSKTGGGCCSKTGVVVGSKTRWLMMVRRCGCWW
jgi:hypothetical protein